VVMITSSIPQEENPCLAFSLARLMHARNKVLLIDCDMRLPSVHMAFQNVPESGLEAIIMEDKKLETW